MVLRIVAGVLAIGAVAFAGPATATTVNIDGGPTGWGCAQCFGGPSVLGSGQIVDLDNEGKPGPLSLTFGPGTYSITNGATTGTYSAFRFDGGNDWAWNFVIGKDVGGNKSSIFKVGSMGIVGNSQAAVANATNIVSYSFTTPLDNSTSTAAYYDTFTLASTTTLNFFIIDGYLSDNAGGVSLNIQRIDIPSALPESSSWALMVVAFGMIGGRLRRRGGGAEYGLMKA